MIPSWVMYLRAYFKRVVLLQCVALQQICLENKYNLYMVILNKLNWILLPTNYLFIFISVTQHEFLRFQTLQSGTLPFNSTLWFLFWSLLTGRGVGQLRFFPVWVDKWDNSAITFCKLLIYNLNFMRNLKQLHLRIISVLFSLYCWEKKL